MCIKQQNITHILEPISQFKPLYRIRIIHRIGKLYYSIIVVRTYLQTLLSGLLLLKISIEKKVKRSHTL
jgi:hypothetical protein